MSANEITSAATLRPFGCELTTLAQADGSAIWKSGGTRVLASVHGPAAPRQASLEQPHAQVSVVVAGRSTENLATDQEEWEPLLRGILESCIHVEWYPRSVVQVICHVLSNDGSVLAACVHAAVAALMDGGVAMRQLPTAAAVRVMHRSDGTYHLSLDPDTEQEQDADQSPKEEPSALICLIVAQDITQNGEDVFTTLAAHSRGGRAPLAIWGTATSLAERARPALTNFMKMALQRKMEARNNE